MYKLIQSNATRWNSYYMSIGRAPNCKLRIQQFCENHHPKRGEGIENDRLKAHHWFLLEKLHDALEPFYEATLCSEGNSNTLSEWVYTLDYVLDSVDGSKKNTLSVRKRPDGFSAKRSIYGTKKFQTLFAKPPERLKFMPYSNSCPHINRYPYHLDPLNPHLSDHHVGHPDRW